MGRLKINDDVDFLRETTKRKSTQQLNQYSRHLDTGAPVFVTYFKQNSIESTTDRGFDNVYSYKGDKSPIRFNKINGVPLYGLNNVSLDLNQDDAGPTPSFTSDAIMLPDTFIPIPNDFFIMDYMDKSILFKVTDINTDTIKSNHYYKISFKFDTLEADVLMNQVVDSFEMIYANVGTENKAIVTTEEYKLINVLDNLYSEFLENFKSLFYDRRSNSFLFNSNLVDLQLYDMYMTYFIIKHNLLNDNDNYKSIGGMMIQCEKPKSFNIEYKYSIFNIIETFNIYPKDKILWYYIPVVIQSISSIFNSRRDYCQTMHYCKEKFVDISMPTIPEYLLDNIITNGIGNVETEFINYEILYCNIITEFINNKGSVDLSKYLDYLTYPEFEYNQNYFYYIPLMVYILRYTKKLILEKTADSVL